MSRLTDSYLPAVTSITEIGTDYLYWVTSTRIIQVTNLTTIIMIVISNITIDG